MVSMQWTQQKKYLAVFIGAVVLGGLVYGAVQYRAVLQLAKLDAHRIDGGWYSSPLSFEGSWYLVPPNEVHDSGIVEGDIPALTNPETVAPNVADDVIADDLGGVAVEVNGEARFYPVQIMNWHEVVHDTLGGTSILVYYGPLTGASAVYALPDNMHFVTSSEEYNNDVLLREEGTTTLWSAIRGTPVIAEQEATLNTSLTRMTSSFMSWGEWKELHGSLGTVLSSQTGYTRDYTRHPYGGYESSPGVFFPVNRSTIPVSAKEPVFVAQLPEGSGAFIATTLLLDDTPTVQVGDTCLVALRGTSFSFARIFDCTVNGQKLSFVRKDTETFTDTETGSVWNASGVAVSGSLRGTQLAEVPSERMYAFALDALFPGTVLSGSEFVFDEETSNGEESFDPSTIDPSTGAAIQGKNVDGATIEIVQ